MYTQIVIRRMVMVVLALLVTAGPVMALVCELDCGAPKPAAQTCHDGAAAASGMSLRDAGHGCRHQHDAPRATVTNASARDGGVASMAAFEPVAISSPSSAEHQLLVRHGPPGSSVPIPVSLHTVLRI